MTTEVESGKSALNNSEDELKYLENEYKKLHDEAQSPSNVNARRLVEL